MRMVILSLGVLLAFAAGLPAYAAPGNYAERSMELVRAGDLAVAQEDFDGAIILYERSVTADPKNVEGYYKMGLAYVQIDRPGRALKFYRTALSIDSNHVQTLEAQALALLQKDNVQKAEAALSKIKRICGDTDCDEKTSVNEAIKQYLAEAVTSDGGDGKNSDAPDQEN